MGIFNIFNFQKKSNTTHPNYPQVTVKWWTVVADLLFLDATVVAPGGDADAGDDVDADDAIAVYLK